MTASCQGVKQERLDWLADNPFYTKRFAFHIEEIGTLARCRWIAFARIRDFERIFSRANGFRPGWLCARRSPPQWTFCDI